MTSAGPTSTIAPTTTRMIPTTMPRGRRAAGAGGAGVEPRPGRGGPPPKRAPRPRRRARRRGLDAAAGSTAAARRGWLAVASDRAVGGTAPPGAPGSAGGGVIGSGVVMAQTSPGPASYGGWGRVSGAGRLYELVLHRAKGGLGPARQAELAQDVADVRPRGPLGDEQRVRRSPCCSSPAPTRRRTSFSRSVSGSTGLRLRLRRASAGRAAARPAGRGGPRRRSAARIAGATSSALGVLEQVARRAGLERRRDLLLLDEAGHRDDLDLGVARP